MHEARTASGNRILYRIVKASRLAELEAGYRASLEGASRDATFRSYVEGMRFSLPEGAEGARSLIVAAVSWRFATAVFTIGGKEREVPFPAGYWDDDVRAPSLMPALAAAEGLGGPERLVAISDAAPMKLIAVRSGLARYGRNNIAYVPGLGSHHGLRAFAVSADLAEDGWGKVEALPECEGCGACERACPNGALRPGIFIADVGECNTLYSEVDDPFPERIAARGQKALMGCPVCQDCCPANARCAPPLRLKALDEEETAAVLGGETDSPLCGAIAAKLRLASAEAASAMMIALGRNLRLYLGARGR